MRARWLAKTVSGLYPACIPLGYHMTVDTPLLPIGPPPPTERADAARNREHLLNVAREMISELGVRRVTMDALAERAQLGKGTVFRRFGCRAGIFAALLDDADVAGVEGARNRDAHGYP